MITLQDMFHKPLIKKTLLYISLMVTLLFFAYLIVFQITYWLWLDKAKIFFLFYSNGRKVDPKNFKISTVVVLLICLIIYAGIIAINKFIYKEPILMSLLIWVLFLLSFMIWFFSCPLFSFTKSTSKLQSITPFFGKFYLANLPIIKPTFTSLGWVFITISLICIIAYSFFTIMLFKNNIKNYKKN
ncbi:MAG: hypothetical protein Ta2E_02410 [Mycoplasmoidaceae bacterium]|nr:MAG: hypothetical protein Ta2E_02410 [Mycoplasmoidaceae bacterium]